MRREKVRNDNGASAVEYSFIVVAIAAVIVLVVFAVGGYTQGMFQDTCAEFAASGASTTGGTCS